MVKETAATGDTLASKINWGGQHDNDEKKKKKKAKKDDSIIARIKKLAGLE
jgi:hypothetical protein